MTLNVATSRSRRRSPSARRATGARGPRVDSSGRGGVARWCCPTARVLNVSPGATDARASLRWTCHESAAGRGAQLPSLARPRPKVRVLKKAPQSASDRQKAARVRRGTDQAALHTLVIAGFYEVCPCERAGTATQRPQRCPGQPVARQPPDGR